MASTSLRPWYRLHWLSWPAVIILVGAIGYQQSLGGLGFLSGSGGRYYKHTEFGWPINHLAVYESGPIFGPGTLPVSYEYHWRYLFLAANVLTWLALMGSTVLVFERWLRSVNRLRLSVGTAFTLFMTCGVLMAMLNGEFARLLPFELRISIDLLSWHSLRSPFCWPLLFAFGCTIYTVGWAVWASSHRLLARFHRNR